MAKHSVKYVLILKLRKSVVTIKFINNVYGV